MPSAPRSLRVVVFNVRRFTGIGGASTVDAVAAALAKLSPDIVGLNEVDLKKRPEALTTVADRLGLHFRFFGHVQGFYGNAILSRYPFLSDGGNTLNGGSVLTHKGREHRIVRGLLTCDVEVPCGEESLRLTVACTHLDHISQAERRAQLRHVCEIVQPRQRPVVFFGDMNALQRADYTDAEWEALSARAAEKNWAAPSHGELAHLEDAGMTDAFLHARSCPRGMLTHLDSTDRATAHVHAPRYRIDYCWLSAPAKRHLTPSAARVCNEVHCSDHFPLLIDLAVGHGAMPRL
eukprot:Hpha_TRINITY_DN17317_c0_g1::TRINITY_DN17317_c0_g1_i1::g.137943::m.137943